MRWIVGCGSLLTFLCLSEAFTYLPKHVRPTFCINLSSAPLEGTGPDIVQSPVLRQVWPTLQRYREQYGHPNIPLGTWEGKQCQVLRRLQLQQKLTPEEVQLLEGIDFRFHSLDDIYHQVDFDEFMQKLHKYASDNDGDLSPPKKYVPDPELGAWVTGLRRLGPTKVDPAHVQQLNDLGFSWTSTRACGSDFMQRYRSLTDQIKIRGVENVLQDIEVQKWVQAQRNVHARNAMSETRQLYMETLFGSEWMTRDLPSFTSPDIN
jgi:hypothetical protein